MRRLTIPIHSSDQFYWDSELLGFERVIYEDGRFSWASWRLSCSGRLFIMSACGTPLLWEE